MFAVLLGLSVGACARDVADCTPIAGSADLLAAGRTVLVGEMHGTREMPAALYRMACSALRRAVPVAVGLEINDLDGALAAYLDAVDEPAASRTFLAQRFWLHGRDGRASAAMFDTIRALKALRRHGLPLTVFALYDSFTLSDEKMAGRLRRERLARPEALILTLTGNIHNMLKPVEWPDGQSQVTMGALVEELNPVAINLLDAGGSAWNCRGVVCGINTLPAPLDGQGAVLAVMPAHQADVYSVEINVGPTTASPPAVTRP